MKLETEFIIGDKVFAIERYGDNENEFDVFVGYIDSIIVEKDDIYYKISCDDRQFKEECVVLYEDADILGLRMKGILEGRV